MHAPLSVNQGRLEVEPDGEIWARAGDKVSKIADDLFTLFERRPLYVDVASIGPQALNQSVKGIAELRSRIYGHGCDLHVQPYFSMVLDENMNEKTRLVLRVTFFDLQ